MRYMPNITPPLLPPHQRPGAWGWYDEEFVENREPQKPQPVAPEPAQDLKTFEIAFQDKPAEYLDPSPHKEGTLIEFNNVQVIENTTTQAENQSNGSISFGSPIDTAESLFTKVDPLFNITHKAAEATVEAASDIFDIFKQVAGTGEYAVKAAPTEQAQKKAEDEHKLKEAKMRIQEFQMQAKEAKQMAQVVQKNKIEQTMVRMRVSQSEVVTHEGSVTISNIFWVALEKTVAGAKHHAGKLARKMVPGSGKGKSKGGTKLDMNLSAQEGQSLVSSSGAIASAG